MNVFSNPSTAASHSTAPSATPVAAAPPARLVSLDALRGFDMFWILGADAMFLALGTMSSAGPIQALARQFKHTHWEGMTFYDLIFPLFIFIVGASLAFSLPRRLARDGRRRTILHILWRAVILFALGMLYNGGVVVPPAEARITGVLHRIAAAYAGAAILFCFLKPRALAVTSVALLIGYWALLTLVPIRDFSLARPALVERFGTPRPNRELVEQAFYATTHYVPGRYDEGFNLANHIDFMCLPGGRLFDPNGILSTLPAIALGILGILASLLLKREDWSDRRKLRWLIAGGAAALALGWLWHLQFPVVKKLWSSSYILVSGGWSLWLLAAFYWAIDVRLWRGWCQPFVWIGTNAITLYLLEELASLHLLAQRLVGGNVKVFLDAAVRSGFGDFCAAAIVLAALLAVGWFLHRRKIFLRV